MNQLVSILNTCGLTTTEYVDQKFNEANNYTNIKIDETKTWVIKNFSSDFSNAIGSYHKCVHLDNVRAGDIFRLRDKTFINYNNSRISSQTNINPNNGTPGSPNYGYGGGGVVKVNLKNNSDNIALGVIMVNGLFFTYVEGLKASMKMVISEDKNISFVDPFPGSASSGEDADDAEGYPTNYALVTLPEAYNRSYYNKNREVDRSNGIGGSLVHSIVKIPPNSTVTRYVQAFFIFHEAKSGGVGIDFRTTVSHFVINGTGEL